MTDFQIWNARDPHDAELWKQLHAAWRDREVMAHPAYLALFAAEHDRPLAAFARTPDGWILYPFVQRAIEGSDQLTDLVTPLGYGGPYFAGDGEAHTDAFWQQFTSWAAQSHVVSEFVRFSLFREQMLPYPGELEEKQTNVVRTLEPAEDAIWSDFDHKVRKNVNKARRSGVTIEVDLDGRRLDDFFRIYTSTMVRRDAQGGYYFPRSLFERFNRQLAGQYAYFHAVLDGNVISTELALVSAHNVYSFLGGTDESAFDLRPNDLLKHELILWAKRAGKRRFVLGGGYAPDDGIFRYKKAFAPTGVVPFVVGHRVLDQRAYDQLVAAQIRKAASIDAGWKPQLGFFPAYRAEPRAAAVEATGIEAKLLLPDDPTWRRIVDETPHDIYHTPQYACLDAHDTEPFAAWVHDGKHGILLPLLRRTIPGHAEIADAITPYGYAGPIWWKGLPASSAVRGQLAKALRELLAKHKIVSLIARLHPLLAPASAFDGIGALVRHGDTVAIDLSSSVDELRLGMRSGHRNEIAQARRFGVVVEHDVELRELGRFAEMYEATMRRLGAASQHMFTARYVQSLPKLGGKANLLVARVNGDVVAGSIFFEEAGYAQYHLSAADRDMLKWRPVKSIIAHAIEWAKERGNRWLHLGGGVGTRTDGVFEFKAGFTPLRCAFHTLRVVADETVYRELCKMPPAAPIAVSEAFFPAYREA